MSVAIITGSAGLIGSEAVRRSSPARAWTSSASTTTCGSRFFGDEASTRLEPRAAAAATRPTLPPRDVDIRDDDGDRAPSSRRYGSDDRSWSSTPRPSRRTTGRRASRTTDFARQRRRAR